MFWLAAGYLGAQVLHGDDGTPADVEVVGQDEVLGPDAARPRPRRPCASSSRARRWPRRWPGCRPGGVDYGGEVSGFPDVLPAPGPQAPLGPPAPSARRVLLGPGAAPDEVLAAWAAGGSVVLHTGLRAEALARVAAQERTDP